MRRIVFFLLLLLIASPIASALLDVSSEGSVYTESGEFASGLTLEAPSIEPLKANVNFTFYVRAYNTTNGFLYNVTQVSCEYHLYNSRGVLQYRNTTPSGQNTFDFYVVASGSNFSSVGDYSYLYHCNNSVSGGFLEVPLLVTNNGDVLSTSGAMIYMFVLIMGLLLLALFVYGGATIKWGNAIDSENFTKAVNWGKYLKVFCIVFSYLTFMWLNWTAFNIALAYTAFSPAARFFEVIYMILLAAFRPLIVVTLIFALIKFVLDLKLDKKIEKGDFIYNAK